MVRVCVASNNLGFVSMNYTENKGTFHMLKNFFCVIVIFCGVAER